MPNAHTTTQSKMENRQHNTLDLIKHIVRVYPRRTAAVALLLMLSGLVEGIGVMSLLPLLEAGLSTGNPPSQIATILGKLLLTIGVTPTFGAFLLVAVLGIVGKAVLTLLASKEMGYAVVGVMTELRIQVLEGVFHSRWQYLSLLQSGRLANAVGIEALQAASVFKSISQLFALLIQVAIYAVVVALVSWQVAVAGFLCSLFAARLLHMYILRSQSAGIAQTDLMKGLANRVTEMLLSIKSVKAMGCEDRLIAVLVKQVNALDHTQRRLTFATEALRVMQEPLAVAILAIGLYAFVTFVGLPLASMMVTAVIFYRLLNRLGTVQQTFQAIVASESAFWSLKAIADQATVERESDQGDNASILFQNKIAFSGVRFAYDDKLVIQDATFDLHFGEYVCITGASGAGKSTLGDLLLRLRDPASGEISVDNTPLHKLGLRAWRSQIGYVPQDPGLFGGSILENVTLSDPTLTRDDVRRALTDAGAWTFVQALPLGMDSTIGDRGATFSGGQQQRIAIARALVRNPRLLLLDEVTSALDPATEASLIVTLKGLRGKVTILAISHQHAMAEAADRQLLMEHGCLRENGPVRKREVHA